MTQPLFIGSGVALVTPFAGGVVDEEALRSLARFQLREGTNALVVNGSTGEAATMTPAEQRRTVEIVVEETAGRVPVIAGAGGSATAAVVALAVAAREAGADGILLAAPPYNKPSQAGILAHFRAVLDAADLPTIVYNVPGRTACNILPATVEALAADPRVVGVKEASSDISQIAEVARRVGERIALYSGNDDQVVPVLSLGGRGVISVLANIAPADTARMVHAFLAGDIAGARELQLRYLPLIAALFREPNPVPVKCALRLLGHPAGDVRLPLLAASAETEQELLRAMGDAGMRVQEDG